MVSRSPKYFSLQMGSKSDSGSIDRLKPVLSEFPVTAQEPPCRGRPPLSRKPLAPVPPTLKPQALVPPTPVFHQLQVQGRRFYFLLQCLLPPQPVETLEELQGLKSCFSTGTQESGGTSFKDLELSSFVSGAEAKPNIYSVIYFNHFVF